MLNVTALITGYETVGDHTEFIVQISCNGGLWLISRRFSDFDQLHTRLTRCFGDLIEARLPEKQWFGRFDPNFLAKRQAKLQEYLELLFQVPGIFEDRSLLHFLELEKHLDLHGNDLLLLGGTQAHGNGMMGSHAITASKSGVMNENDRLSAIVEHAAQAFIDISEVPEPLEADQAVQRKHEILTAAQTILNEQKLMEQFTKSMRVLQLPTASREPVLARLEASAADHMTYEQERTMLLRVYEEHASQPCQVVCSDLIALMDADGTTSSHVPLPPSSNPSEDEVATSSSAPGSSSA